MNRFDFHLMLVAYTFVFLLFSHTTCFAERVWLQHTIDRHADAKSIDCADLDGDGDLDFLAAGGRCWLAWWDNHDYGYYLKDVIFTDGSSSHAMFTTATDLDGDNDVDILYSEMNNYEPPYNYSFYFENINNESFEYEFFRQGSGCPLYFFPIDFDHDGDVDLLSTGSKIEILYNLGNFWFSGDTIYDSYNLWDHMIQSLAFDIDNDGDYDVFGGYGWWHMWFENYNAKFKYTRDYDRPSPFGNADQPCDFDGDGDQDIVGPLRWYENQGITTHPSQFNYEQHEIPNSMGSVSDYVVSDFDNDQDVDLVAVGNSVRWYANNGTAVAFTEQILADNPAQQVCAGDIDGDGDTDIVTATTGDNSCLRWYENQRAGEGYRLLASVASNGEVGLAWLAAGSTTSAVDEYRIFRNGSFVGATQDLLFTDTLSTHGTCEYSLTTVFTDNESLISDSVTVFWFDENLWPLIEDFDDGFPDGWTIESTGTTTTWVIDQGDVLGVFRTPYMLLDGENREWSGLPIDARLVSPEIDIAGVMQITLYYEHQLQESPSQSSVEYLPGSGGDWMQLVEYTSNSHGIAEHNVTGLLQGESTFRLGFYYNSPAYSGAAYWAVDNVAVHVLHEAGNASGSFNRSAKSNQMAHRASDCYQLKLAGPNPFNVSTDIVILLPEPGFLTLEIFNLSGRKVAAFANGDLCAGRHVYTFDGSALASGVYFVRATVPGQLNDVQKLVLMK